MKVGCIKYVVNQLFLDGVPKFLFVSPFTQKKINIFYCQNRPVSTSQPKEDTNELSKVFIKGWVREIKFSENYSIIDVNNGSSLTNTKVVVPKCLYKPRINIGTPVIITGENDKEKGEIIATDIEIKGTPYGNEDLSWTGRRFKQLIKSNKDFEKCNEKHLFHPRFRSRFEFFNSRFRVRSKFKSYLHQYFDEQNYIEIDSPILTRYIGDAESATFYVDSKGKSCEDKKNPVTSYFEHPVYLSTCRRYHLECALSGLNKVYSIGPLFKGGQMTGKTLFEYWKVDCEEIFSENKNLAFENLLMKVEKFVKQITKNFLEMSSQDVQLSEDVETHLQSVLDKKWQRITYDEAVSILKEKKSEIGYQVVYGTHFASNCQKALLKTFDDCPIFVTDYPYNLKPFNVALKEDQDNNVLVFELILPYVGTVASGSVKEKDYLLLKERLKEYGAEEYYSWYTDVHKWGVAPTRGFSLGIEKFIYFLLKDKNVKNLIPFPRSHFLCEG